MKASKETEETKNCVAHIAVCSANPTLPSGCCATAQPSLAFTCTLEMSMEDSWTESKVPLAVAKHKAGSHKLTGAIAWPQFEC